MRIAVIGGLGFIGKYLTKELVREGYDVVVIDIRKDKVPKGAELYIADVTDFERIKQALSDIDIVYDLAGVVLSTARKNPYLATRLDILGMLNVLEASVKSNVDKVIYSSSFYAYDGLSPRLEVDETRHGDIFDVEMFGFVKLAAERLIHEYNRQYGLKYVILRYGPVYGPDNRCSCVVYEFIKAGLQGKPLVVWGAGKRKNQYTYVGDIAKGSVLALKSKNEIFNLISPERVSIRQIAELLSEKYGFKVEYDINKPEGPSMPYISPRKAEDILGWKPMTLEEGIERTVLEMKVSIRNNA